MADYRSRKSLVYVHWCKDVADNESEIGDVIHARCKLTCSRQVWEIGVGKECRKESGKVDGREIR